MKCLRILLATLITVLSTVLFAPSFANAQSVYDNVIIRAQKPELQDKDGNTIDVSTTWLRIMQGDEQLIESLNLGPYNLVSSSACEFDPSEDASWALSQQYSSSGKPNRLTLHWIDDKSYNLGFYSYNSDRGLIPPPSSLSNMCVVDTESSSTTRVYAYDDNTSSLSSITSKGSAIAFNHSNDYYSSKPVFINWGIDYPEDYQGIIPPDSLIPPTKTPVWLNYTVKFFEGEKMSIQSDNWTNYRDRVGGGIRYGDVGGTSDITLCRIEDKDNTGCAESLAFVEDKSGPISLEYPKEMVGQVGYYKVFINNANKEPNIPPFDERDYPFDVKNRSIIVFNDGISTTVVSTVGYYEDEPYFPQYDDNVYYNKFMNHNLIDDHGLLNVVLAPIGYLSELPKVTCTPLNLPMPSRFGEDINLPCMSESVYQPQFPQIFQLYQLLITAIFSYMVGLRIFQNIKEMSSEKDDSIEVVKL